MSKADGKQYVDDLTNKQIAITDEMRSETWVAERPIEFAKASRSGAVKYLDARKRRSSS